VNNEYHTRLSGNTREYSSLASGTRTRRVIVVAYLLSASVHSANSMSTLHSQVTLVPLSDHNNVISYHYNRLYHFFLIMQGEPAEPLTAAQSFTVWVNY
jgi:hypothetical protein